MKCTKCGADFENGTLFCPKCGREIQWVPEYNTMETWMQQKQMLNQEKKQKELEERKERERAEKRAQQEKQRRKQKNRILAGSITAVIAVSAIGLFLVHQKQYNSFNFQMAQAETKFSNKNYSEALKYVERALSIKPESAEANILEAKIYMKEDNQEAALSILLSVTEMNPDSTSAYGELLRLYEKNQEYDKIKELMAQATDEMRETYQNYVCKLPTVSKAGGTYNEELELLFEDIPEGTEVYYTLNGAQPDRNSRKYEKDITISEEETVTLKYIAYNKKGIPSDIGEEVYQISYDEPEAPNIAPSSGKYEYSEQIIVTAQEGCDIYFAFDEEPTLNSRKYTGPISIPTGEHTFSAIAVDSRGKVSQINSAVYVYYGE